MKEFSYPYLDPKTKKLINEKSFSLFVVSSLAQVLLREQYDLTMSEKSQHLVVDYKEASLHYVESIASNGGLISKTGSITYLTNVIRDNIIKASQNVSNLGGRLLYMNDLEELCQFIKELSSLTVGGFNVKNNFAFSEDDMSYTAEWSMNYDGNLWLWRTEAGGNQQNKDLITHESVNGLPLSHEDEVVNLQGMMLKTILPTMVDDEIVKKETEDGLKDPEVLELATDIANILGFEPSDYVPLVYLINLELSELNVGSRVSGIQLKRVLRSLLRVDEQVIEKLTSALIE